jgi:hypothetical protein
MKPTPADTTTAPAKYRLCVWPTKRYCGRGKRIPLDSLTYLEGCAAADSHYATTGKPIDLERREGKRWVTIVWYEPDF